MKYQRYHGEAASADKTAIVSGREELHRVLKDYDLNDVYNLDETGLFNRMGPSGILATGKVAGSKKPKDRITVALTCNATGSDKRRVVVITPVKRPRCFGKTFKPNLYTDYFWNKKAWVTAVEFKEVPGSLHPPSEASLHPPLRQCIQPYGRGTQPHQPENPFSAT